MLWSVVNYTVLETANCEDDLKHKRRTRRPKKKDYGYICAWCLTELSEFQEHFGFGAKAPPDVDLSELEGTWIDIQLVSAGRTVQMGVTTRDSPARTQLGYQLFFVACSEDCCKQLQDALKDDIKIGRLLSGESKTPE